MPNGYVKYSFLIPFLFSINIIFAQNQNLLKNFLSVEEGLSNDEVTSIIQDNDGFIWIGTRGGLNRYDGYQFDIFNQIPGDSNSLVNPSIESLFVDRVGNIWIGTKSGGVSKYNPDTGNFKNIISDYNHSNSILSDNRILSFYEDGAGKIWMGAWENGLTVYDEKTNSSKQYLEQKRVNSMVETSSGKIWIGTNEGLFEYLEATDSMLLHSAFGCEEIQYDKERNVLWIATGSNSGIVKFDLRNNKSVIYSIGNSDSDPSNVIHSYESILVDNQGKIWVGTWGTGFYLFDPVQEIFNRVLIYPENRATLNKDYDAVLEIFQDRENNLWLGTNGGGVCVLTPKLEFNVVGYHPEVNKGLLNTRIMTVVDDNSGNLWLGTIGSGLIWSPDRENFYPVKYPKRVGAARFFIIKFLFEDGEGKVWVGTNTGTYFIDFIDGIPQMINAGERFRNSDFAIQAVSMLATKNMFWLGTLQNGLFLLDKENNFKQIKHITEHDKPSGRLQSNRISFLKQDSKDRVWIGTYNGLHVFNPIDSSVHIAENYLNITGKFTGNIITCIDEDQNGNIWVGTPNGLNRLSEIENDIFKVDFFTDNDGLASNFVKGISHDSKGNIWISTNSGISKLTIESDNRTVINYNEMDGVGGKNFTEASVYKNKKGELFFGGTYGLTFFQPEQIKSLPTGNSPVFTGLKIFNQIVAVNQKFGSCIILTQSIIHQKKITIPFRFNNFEIQFSSLDYKGQNRSQYSYILENHDQDWNVIGSRHFVNFNNLKPGEYNLKVISSNSHNIWNNVPAELKIRILPPFWQTWYALVFYILVVISIVTLLRRNAVKQVRLTNNLEIEKLQHEQDQKLNEMKLRFFTNISHEFRTPLTLILAPLKELIGKKEHFNLNDEASNKIKMVQNNALRLMKLVNQLLDLRKTESGNMKLNASLTNLEDFVKEICHPFDELSKINNISFSYHSSLVTKQIWFDRNKTEVILNNLISNAFKYVNEKGKIEVALYEEEDEVLISVIDDGPGILPIEIKHIFDRFYRVGKSENDGSSGIGLDLTKRYTELHKGHISVTSEPNVYTEFIVSLPKGNKHLKPDEIIEIEKTSNQFILKESILSSVLPSRTNPLVKSEDCVLVVEDDKDLNVYLVNLLETHYRVESVKDGAEGYKKAVDLIPSLIISDVVMPKMDGFEFCNKIRENESTALIPFIFLTAKSDEQFRLLAIQSGADDLISKPFDPALLLEKVKNILVNRKKLQKQFSKSIRLEPSDIEITSYEVVFIEKAIAIIEENLQNHKFSSDFLASELNMSNSSLYRKLKGLIGSSTAEFIRSIRIKRAAQLLADKEKTITEIAYEVGFNDVKHFRTVFQKQFGCSPSEYREKIG